MTLNQVSGKKQQKLVKFSDFVSKANGKDRAKLMAEEMEHIEVDDPSLAFTAIIDGDSPYQDRKAVMDLFSEQCLEFSEGGGQVFCKGGGAVISKGQNEGGGVTDKK
jgi:hypothetical protein